ncbi:MAG: TolC family protein [Flavobacteriaceae bacterium]|jgi:outer membrane protein TolC|nr:TolC family protein [Flavobacteriaceae bacterium]
MKNKISVFIVMTICTLSLSAQIQVLTLEECHEKARENYPLIRQHSLLEISENYTLDNIFKVYLPQVSLNGQASYQTDVTQINMKGTFPIDISQFIETMNKDQYKIYAQVEQLLWDGGQSRARAKTVKAATEIEKQQIEVSLHAIKDKINQLYFGILSINEQLKQLDILDSDLQANKDLAQSMLKNGVVMPSDLDLIQVEFLNLEQKKIELHSYKNAYLQMLSVFTNEKIGDFVELQLPDDISELPDDIKRPELILFDKQRLLYQSQKSDIKAKNRPVFGLFIQGGYGRPGLNMLEPEFKTYALGGVKFTWNFGNLYTYKNDLNLIRNNLNTIDVQEQTFRFNTTLEMNRLKPEIEKYKKLMDKDEKIVDLRSRIKNISRSKYENGICQMKDLIADTNAENQARQTKIQHYIQYLISTYDYQYTQGN